MTNDIQPFLSALRARVEPLEIEMSDAWWQANVSASEESEMRAGNAQKAITRLYADKAMFETLRGMDTSRFEADHVRQHYLLLNTVAGNQMEDAVIEELVDTERRVESAYNTYRPELLGQPTGENALRDILRVSDDSELRRKAWEASKEIGVHVEKDVLRLVEIRNQEARRLGYANYYQMSLRLQEQDEETLFALLEDVTKRTESLWRSYKADLDTRLAARFKVTIDELQAWHYPDPFFQEAPTGETDFDAFYKNKNLETLTTNFFDAIGLDVRDILARSDLYERDNKCQHAFCITVGRYGDVRVLCNCNESERWMGTMLHEFGHAVYDKYIGEDLPFFLRGPSHTLTTEAVAMLMGRLSRNAAFLTRYVGVPAAEAQAVSAEGNAETAAQLLILVRWVAVMAHFERALYTDPTQNLNALWWTLVARYQNVRKPEGGNAPDWAAKLHLALAPVYYHNYLLGEMMASQLLDYLQEKTLPSGDDDYLVSSPAVGDYLRHQIFACGARLPWNALIESATGEPLNPTHFVRHLQKAAG
jgi:peptidyl-dipeptidase A